MPLLLAQVGGWMGFAVGASFISFAEIFYFLARFLLTSSKKLLVTERKKVEQRGSRGQRRSRFEQDTAVKY